MHVLVLTGPESSGKSTLAQALQEHFGGILVGEYVRHFIEQEARATCFADVSIIAQGQLAWEDQARRQKPYLLILDTHLLSNMLWSKVLFGDIPAWLEHALLERHYDLHLLLDPQGIPWQADGQRCQSALAERIAFYTDCQQWLKRHQQRYYTVKGDWQERRNHCIRLISAWLEQTK